MKHSKRRAAPKKLRVIQTSRHLRVTHRRHSWHVTPHRTTSYPMLAMILLCVGVFLASWTRYVAADYPAPIDHSYTVHASVPGPPPTDPATIDSPATGTKYTSTSDLPITVSGSCPVNTYETLYRNGAFSGVALCDITGHYELITGLFPGANQLQVRDFSQTDVGGPLSNIVTVYYEPPVPPPSQGSSGSTSAGSRASGSRSSGAAQIGEPLIFKTVFIYEGHYTGTTSTWQLAIEGGTAPYAISVDWGDGSHGLISRPRAGSFNLDHVYKKAGGYKGSYVTKFSASDADDTQTFLQLLAIVNNPPAAAGAAKHTPGAGSSKSIYLIQLMKYVWPSYAIVVLMLFSFWLGERREYQHLKPRLRKPRHA